jgi:hypothetical protein|tara:strand:+ start:849 stop:1325 length:477 start_codon:yes stop_codon:yes gene_type:complete
VKKAQAGGGLMMNIGSILLLIGILTIFYIVYVQNIPYSEISSIEQIITSKKVASDGGLTLKNLMNTPVENTNFYEFILMNKNDKEKIKNKLDGLMNFVCGTRIEEFCSWDLELEFSDGKLFFTGPRLSKNFKTPLVYTLTLPDYNNELVEVKLTLLKI